MSLSISIPNANSDLFRNSRTAPTWIPSLHFHDGIDQLLRRALPTGTTPAPGREQQAIFPLCQHMVKMQEHRRLAHNGGAEKTRPANEQACAAQRLSRRRSED